MPEEKVHFRFSTNILARLGEELNPSPSEGLIELIKNSYDADAKTCYVELHNVHMPGGKIVITDDGNGMDEQDIIDGWLILGKSNKSENPITKLGRIKTGNKGLGRLAAIRLGEKTILYSVHEDNLNYVNHLSIDWHKFEKADLVEDVPLTIEKYKNEEEKKKHTIIILDNLKSVLSKSDVKKLSRAMILLADPFGDNPNGFKPILRAKEYEDIEKLVASKYFSEAEFHLIATLKNGKVDAKVLDWKDDIIYSASHEEISKKESDYNCPNAIFHIWVFILDKETFSTRSSTKGEVQEWLRMFGGVHLYYNGIRVLPYGDSGNDWLDMNLKRSASPELRPSTNTSMGKISVEDVNNVLIQKTDRSGFVDNIAFSELKQFAQDSLNWMAKKRLNERENKRSKEKYETQEKAETSKKDFEAILKHLPPRHQKELSDSFINYEKNMEKIISNYKKELQLYRTLSTVGITASVFAHESGNNPLKIVSQSIGTIKRRVYKYLNKKYEEEFKNPIDRIIESVKSLSVLSKVSLSLVEYEKRRSSRINLHEIISNVILLYKPFTKNRETIINVDFATGTPYMRGSIAALESIITNLLNNSLNAFEKVNIPERNILIKTIILEEKLIDIRVLDNGPGIKEISVKDIWLPGESTRVNGTGLGLTIVRDTVQDLGGKVNAIEKSELGGAEIIITLPILGA